MTDTAVKADPVAVLCCPHCGHPLVTPEEHEQFLKESREYRELRERHEREMERIASMSIEEKEAEILAKYPELSKKND